MSIIGLHFVFTSSVERPPEKQAASVFETKKRKKSTNLAVAR